MSKLKKCALLATVFLLGLKTKATKQINMKPISLKIKSQNERQGNIHSGIDPRDSGVIAEIFIA